MSKRHRRQEDGEPEFGSDSFLDVISNMVEILIILILMVAFRAKRAPVTAQELAAAAPQTDANLSPLAPPGKGAGGEGLPPSSAHDTTSAPSTSPPQELNAADEQEQHAQREAEKQQLLARAAQYEGLIRRLENELQTGDDQSVSQQLAAVRSQQQSADEALRELKASLEKRKSEHVQVRASLQDEQSEIETLKQQLDQLNEQLKVVAARERNKEKLRHKVTPLGLTVYGKETYFRVSRGRISAVPLEELSKLVGERIRQNANWIVKSNRHQGEVGPLNGYVMKYEVVRASNGLVEDLNHGFGTVKLEVPRFTIEPTVNFYDEKVADSLRTDGLFVRQLAQVSSDTTVTIWVYPDSFAEYRQLATFAQQHGFVVAARPLPTGLPITGSSQGSRSVGQ